MQVKKKKRCAAGSEANRNEKCVTRLVGNVTYFFFFFSSISPIRINTHLIFIEGASSHLMTLLLLQLLVDDGD